MTNKEFDKWLRESLSDVRPEPDPQDWDHFVDRIEESESQMDSGFDANIRDAMAGLGAGLTPDWTKMEELLKTDEQLFDQHIKETVQNYEVPYNPVTWPMLHALISEEEKMRQRLIYAKVLEVAAILILFLTFYNFFPEFKSSVLHPGADFIMRTTTGEKSIAMTAPLRDIVPEENAVVADGSSQTGRSPSLNPVSPQTFPSEFSPDASTSEIRVSVAPADNVDVTGIEDIAFIRSAAGFLRSEVPESFFSISAPPRVLPSTIPIPEGLAVTSLGAIAHIGASPLSSFAAITPVLKKASHKRFGMMASADINTLYMPEENFYSQGRYINFSEKEIVAGGYSAGASLLFDFKHVMIETGLMYSSKNFRPDRNLFIGSSLDRHTLDFENITLNVLGVPLNVHWKIDGKGLWRVYATSGITLHVIANAHYDLIAENPFTSSAAQDPMQIQNRNEVQRVREHMLDGAKFRTKGYLTAVGGFGVERYLNSRLSLFVQPMYEYQIPFLGLIEHGKHQQNGSLLLGTRISL